MKMTAIAKRARAEFLCTDRTGDLGGELKPAGSVHRGMKSTKKIASAEPSAPFVDPSDVRDRPLHDDISARAKELWIGYGRPDGRDTEIWLEAERQLLGVDPQVREEGGGSVAAIPRARSQNAIIERNQRKAK